MKKPIYSLSAFFCICVVLFFACGSSSTSQTDTNETDSLTNPTNQTNQILETDDIKKITYEILTDSGTIELAKGEEGSPTASFKEELLVVTEVPSQTNLEAIQAILQKKQEYSGDAKEALAQKKKEYREGYVEMNSEEVMGSSAEWERDLSIQVIYNDNYFTTIGFYLNEFAGLSRSYYTENYLILDLKNSKQITLSDIFDENGISKLTQKLTDKALEMAKKEGVESLEDYGFSVEKIEPTEQFLVNEQGIEFTYNRSDITVSSIPAPTFFVSWKEVDDFMKTDSPLRALMK